MRRSKSRRRHTSATEAEGVEEGLVVDEEQQQAKDGSKRSRQEKPPDPARKRAKETEQLLEEAAATSKDRPQEPAPPAFTRRSARGEKNKEPAPAGGEAATGHGYRMYTEESYKAQYTAMEMLIGNEGGGWLFALDVEGRGDCWAFAHLACKQLLPPHYRRPKLTSIARTLLQRWVASHGSSTTARSNRFGRRRSSTGLSRASARNTNR